MINVSIWKWNNKYKKQKIEKNKGVTFINQALLTKISLKTLKQELKILLQFILPLWINKILNDNWDKYCWIKLIVVEWRHIWKRYTYLYFIWIIWYCYVSNICSSIFTNVYCLMRNITCLDKNDYYKNTNKFLKGNNRNIL